MEKTKENFISECNNLKTEKEALVKQIEVLEKNQLKSTRSRKDSKMKKVPDTNTCIPEERNLDLNQNVLEIAVPISNKFHQGSVAGPEAEPPGCLILAIYP